MILVEWNWEIDAQRGHDDLDVLLEGNSGIDQGHHVLVGHLYLDVLLEGNSGIDYERRHDGYRCTNSHLN